MQKSKNLQSIHKSSLLKQVRQAGLDGVKVWIAPNLVAPTHVNDGWYLGMEIDLHVVTNEDQSYGYCVFQVDEDGLPLATDLDNWLDSFKHWNCNKELGYRIKFWIEGDAQ